jgi:hypothetical protein
MTTEIEGNGNILQVIELNDKKLKSIVIVQSGNMLVM